MTSPARLFPEEDRRWTIRLALALAAIAALRLLSLQWTGLELFFDEAQYWAWSRHLDFGYFSKPGMIAWIIAATTALCGNDPFAVRLAAPLVHIATAVAVYILGRRLYGARTGFYAALGFALMPAVALSSLLISTDVPLLFFWTLGLIAADGLMRRPAPGPAFGYGLAVAFGLNAKYAMIYLPALTLAYLLATPARRTVLKSPWLWAGIAVGLAGFVPNLIWNMGHAFVTFGHTGDNIGIAHEKLHLAKPFEFLASQFAIAGPVLPVAALLAAFGRLPTARPDADRFLLFHSLPVIAVIAVNGLFGNANANWAATAFPALAVVATAALLEGGHRRWLAASLAIGLAAALIVGPGSVAFRYLEPPPLIAQARHMVHWRAFGERLAQAARKNGLSTVVMDGRSLSAQGTYLLRDSALAVRALKLTPGAPPADHFQMVAPWSPGDPTPVMLVSGRDPARLGLPDDLRVTAVGDIQTGIDAARNGRLTLYRIDASPQAVP